MVETRYYFNDLFSRRSPVEEYSYTIPCFYNQAGHFVMDPIAHTDGKRRLSGEQSFMYGQCTGNQLFLCHGISMIIYVLGDRDFFGGTGFLPPVYGGPGVIRIRGARCNLRPGGQGFQGFFTPVMLGNQYLFIPIRGGIFCNKFSNAKC